MGDLTNEFDWKRGRRNVWGCLNIASRRGLGVLASEAFGEPKRISGAKEAAEKVASGEKTYLSG
jgi:hypothetical protein